MTTGTEPARDHARRIAAAVTDRWVHCYGPSRLEVPMSVVASISLLHAEQPTAYAAPPLLYLLSEVGPGDFRRERWTQWNRATTIWPTLHHHWVPFFEWMEPGSDRNLLTGAQAVAAGCIDAGLSGFLGDPFRRRNVDLLGVVLHRLRREMFTGMPDPIRAGLHRDDEHNVARIQPGCTLTIQGAGTGTRLMHIAARLRRRDIDPAGIRWQAREIDDLAAACLAVNAVLWGLGRDVLIGTAEEPDWLEAAREERAAALCRNH
ncbi:hypothetical protein HDA32_005821 [Spinactinospora alkalitolerans]|uniref:Uncharacterized protein n=1 Tax=Spinactinospora alkalitolerans TaxID=687207 RepID=A0A852U3E8_9ACTN|nr:hypothetical protein [Spinactinospora alkalitolerans]NYE50701.1 hypothetical protein [Spinactinospora alkalitolerans]